MEEEKLTRSLSARHIQMIALGGTIGVRSVYGCLLNRHVGQRPSVMGACDCRILLYLIMRF